MDDAQGAMNDRNTHRSAKPYYRVENLAEHVNGPLARAVVLAVQTSMVYRAVAGYAVAEGTFACSRIFRSTISWSTGIRSSRTPTAL